MPCGILALLTLPSDMRPVVFVREQLPRLPPPYQSRSRDLPATVTCAAQVGSHSTDEWRGSDIRCDQDGGSERDRSTQLAAVVHRPEQRWHTAGHGV
jgi:hypothetical protein